MPRKESPRLHPSSELLVVNWHHCAVDSRFSSPSSARRAGAAKHRQVPFKPVRQLGTALQMYMQASKGKSIPYYLYDAKRRPGDFGIGQPPQRLPPTSTKSRPLPPMGPEPHHRIRMAGAELFQRWGAPIQVWPIIGKQTGSYGLQRLAVNYYNDRGERLGLEGGFISRAAFTRRNSLTTRPSLVRAKSLAFMDSGWVDTWPFTQRCPHRPLLRPGPAQSKNRQTRWARVCIRARHGGKPSNVAFCDGHAATVSPFNSFWSLYWSPKYVATQASARRFRNREVGRRCA